MSATARRAICRDCSGAIDSVVELLQGRLSKHVMTRICEDKTGLFPAPREVTFDCSCPDWASMCKHVATVLYGIGARLDEKPELLFLLRNVNHHDLSASAGRGLRAAAPQPSAGKILNTSDLSEIFGIDVGQPEPWGREDIVDPAVVVAEPKARPKPRAQAAADAPTPKSRRRLPEQDRARLSRLAKARWAKAKKAAKKR